MEAIPFQLGSPHALVQELLRRNVRRKDFADSIVPANPPKRFTIALSREAGTRAGEIASAIARSSAGQPSIESWSTASPTSWDYSRSCWKWSTKKRLAG